VCGETDGVRNIAPMLNITRLWNGISAAALMRRAVALALDYARKRLAFGATLIEKPLHVDTLAGLRAEAEAAFHLAFYVAEMRGLSETGGIDEDESLLLRLMTPVMKLTTALQAVHVASEVLESFGGAGYVEDTGLPVLLRDSQVLPIWEGTTNVLSLDALRALGSDASRTLQVLKTKVSDWVETARDDRLKSAARICLSALTHAEIWLMLARQEDGSALEAGARRFALTLGRAVSLALLIKHARWSFENEGDERAAAAARRFSSAGIDLLNAQEMDDARLLVNESSTR